MVCCMPRGLSSNPDMPAHRQHKLTVRSRPAPREAAGEQAPRPRRTRSCPLKEESAFPVRSPFPASLLKHGSGGPGGPRLGSSGPGSSSVSTWPGCPSWSTWLCPLSSPELLSPHFGAKLPPVLPAGTDLRQAPHLRGQCPAQDTELLQWGTSPTNPALLGLAPHIPTSKTGSP